MNTTVPVEEWTADEEVAGSLEDATNPTLADNLSPRDEANHGTSSVQMLDTEDPLNLPKEKISAALTEKLAQGFETYYGGLFLIIPFLLQLKVCRFAQDLWTDLSSKGLSALQVYLFLLFSTLGGIKNLNRVGDVQDLGLAVLAGLPKIPSPAALHNYLGRARSAGLAKVKLSTARALRRIGLIPGRIINIDVHISEYFGKERLPKGHHGTKEKAVRCWATMVAQDQETRNPIYHETYLKHRSIFEILPEFIQKVRSIVGVVQWVTLVFDREFFKGDFFTELMNLPRVKFITLAKNCKTVVEQLNVIPEKSFKALCDGKEVMTTYLHITDCSAPLRTIVIKIMETGNLIGVITNDEKTPEDVLIRRYARRWRIEILFKDTVAFLHLNSLPGTKQVKIDALFYIKFLAFSVHNYLRRQLGGRYASMNIETMFSRLFKLRARVQLVSGKLIVRFSYFKDQEIIIEKYRNINEKLLRNNIDSRIPWLGNAQLEFVFEDKNGNSVS